MSYVDPPAPQSGQRISTAYGSDVKADIELHQSQLAAMDGRSPSAGLTTNLSVRSGVVTVRDEKLNAVEAGYLTQGSSSDQHAGLQSFLTAIGTAVGGQGGSGYIPSGVYHMGSGTVTYPSGVSCGVAGEMPLSSFGTAQTGLGGTVLQWDTDPGGAPHTTYGITLGGSGGVPQSLSQMSLYGPSGGSGAAGNLPCSLGAINARENNVLRDLNISQFSSGVGFGGTSQSYDHSTPRDLRIASCGYGFNFLTGSSGAGDFNAHNLNLNGSLAAIGVASNASSGLTGSSWVGCGMYGPIGIHRYNDQSGLHGGFMTQASFINTDFETEGVAVIFDDLWTNASLGGFMTGCFFSNGIGYTTPNASGTLWSGTFSCSGSSTSITISSGIGSFVFWPGMNVTGSGVPAGTTITAVSPSWPYSGSVTLTVSNSVTSPTSVTCAMPLLATWVCYSITNCEATGPMLGTTSTGYPMFACQQFINNRFADALTIYKSAQAGPTVVGSASGGPMTSTGTCTGNVYGARGDFSGMVLGNSIPIGSVAAGDLLMARASHPGQVVKCDGTRRPVGVAILANNASSNGNVDFLVQGVASTLGPTITVNNKTASNIAAGALVKADASNAGGVTTASSANDGFVIGVNGSSIINAGSSGPLDELWL